MMKISTQQCKLESDRMGVISRDLRDIAERTLNSDDKAKLLTAASELDRTAVYVRRLGQVVGAVATRPTGIQNAPLFGQRFTLWEAAGFCCEKAYDDACSSAG